MKKGSHRGDRRGCRRQAVVETKLGLFDLLLCAPHFALLGSGQWFKDLPA